MPGLLSALCMRPLERTIESSSLVPWVCFARGAWSHTSTTNVARYYKAYPWPTWIPPNSSRSKPRSLRPENPLASRFIWKIRKAWTAVLFRKFPWRIAEVDLLNKVFSLVLLSALGMTGANSAPQQGHFPSATGANVNAEDLLAQPSGADWTSYNGDYTGRRSSSLREINAESVAEMTAGWVFQPGNSERLEATPVVINGMMYLTSANDAFALDARTGRLVWHHQRPVSAGLLDDAAAHKSRGVGVWRHFVYMETDDAHLLCLDARSGNLVWDIPYADKTKHYGATSAPLVVKDEVIVGASGGDSGVRGFLAAFDTLTGTLKWRFWTIPGPGEFGSASWPGDSYLHGGGTTWMPGAYDATFNTVYWTTSNAAPDFVGDSRPRDDLYTTVGLALNPDTGQLKRYFQ